MSNLGPYGGAGKNGPWSRAATAPNNNLVPNNNLQQQLMNQTGVNNLNSNIMPFQQQQVFQNIGLQQQNLGLGLQQLPNPAVSLAGNQLNSQLFQQVGAVTYPNPRALNATAFQTPKPASIGNIQNNTPANTTQKVFTGTVTAVHDNFGFVDEDVFFQTSTCVKGSNPVVGDRVLVEALFNPRMPFKWNATRLQVLPMTGNPNTTNRPAKNYNSISNNYNAVPPPSSEANNGCNNFNRPRPKAAGGRGRERERSRDRERDDDEIERKRRREDRIREREKEDKKSPLRRRSRSPKSRRRSRIVPRYMVQIPKIALDLASVDVLEVRRRYTNLYVPSDFFNSNFRWLDAFPADKPFTLNKPCLFHIMNKSVESIVENDAVLEPPDADYLFSAKVMLMSVPGMEDMYQKCCAMAEDKDRRERDSEERDYVHPTRLINFLVGLRGKNETMAIGGPWSPSLDGENPDKDPAVLIKTAIRCCKALTGIDLSNCTKWYRFVELYYRRADNNHGKQGRQASGGVSAAATASSSSAADSGRSATARVETVVLFLPDVWSCLPTRLEWDVMQQSYRKQLERQLRADQEADEAQQGDEKEEEPSNDKAEPTHYSQLDPKTMSVADLRKELKARSINTSGLKSQLIAKLSKALKSEAAKLDDPKEDSEDVEDEKRDTEEKKIDEKERQQLEKRYTLPEQQHIVVHPSKTAKSGKFDCTVMSLSLLLDYRPEDTKEHSFEVSLFAELFNEMLMRDFGFCIYRALHDLPDKPKEKDDKKRDKDEKRKDDDKKDKDKRDKKGSVKSDHDSDDDDFDEDDDSKDKRSKDKKKRERPKMFTKERHLLLSFIYFDQTHCGYIFEKDIEELLYTLGLNLSRAQVRKLVGKVITRDSLHYRKLTDKPKEEDFIVIDDSEKDSNVEELAAGNKKLLPIFVDTIKHEASVQNKALVSENDDGFVTFRGALVDVAKLLAQLDRSEKARLDTEARMMDMKAENSKLAEKYVKVSNTVKSLTGDLKDYKEKLKSSEDSLHRITASSRLFHSTLAEIRDKIDPVLQQTLGETNGRSKQKDKDRERRDECKSRWENCDSQAKSPNDAGGNTLSTNANCNNTALESKPVNSIANESNEKRTENAHTKAEKEEENEVVFKAEVIDEVGEIDLSEPEITIKQELM